MGFSGPPTSSDEGSDLRRAYLSRLCGVLRLSQPLDALLRLRPIGLVSCRSVPGLFAFRGSSPPGSRHASRRALSSVPFLTAGSLQHSRGFEDSCIRKIRTVGPVLPGCRRPILSWPFTPRGLSPRFSTPCFHRVSSHGLPHSPDRFFPCGWTEVPPRRTAVVVCALQSFKEPWVRLSLARQTSLHGLRRPRRAEARVGRRGCEIGRAHV